MSGVLLFFFTFIFSTELEWKGSRTTGEKRVKLGEKKLQRFIWLSEMNPCFSSSVAGGNVTFNLSSAVAKMLKTRHKQAGRWPGPSEICCNCIRRQNGGALGIVHNGRMLCLSKQIRLLPEDPLASYSSLIPRSAFFSHNNWKNCPIAWGQLS